MPKITFMGAGSTVFAKNVLGDSMMTPALAESTIALYDIDAQRLEDSRLMLENLNRNCGNKARIEAYLGVENRKDALRGANYVVNAIQVGLYDPCTITDFEVPKKYGLRQTIADTLGIGGIFRALRTIPVMLDFAHDMGRSARTPGSSTTPTPWPCSPPPCCAAAASRPWACATACRSVRSTCSRG